MAPTKDSPFRGQTYTYLLAFTHTPPHLQSSRQYRLPHNSRRQLAACEAGGRIPVDELSAVPGLGSSMRFRPTALSNALVIHDDDVADLLLAIDELDLLGRRWWLTIEIVRVVQVTCPHLPDKVLCLRIGEVVVLVNLRVNASKLVCVSHARLTYKSGGHGSQPLVRELCRRRRTLYAS